MSFPTKLLNDGESVIVSTRTHPKALILPVLVGLVTLAVAAWVSTLGSGTPATVLRIAVWVLAAVVLLAYVVRPVVGWLTTTYTFTDRRFIRRGGFIAKEGRTIPLNRISGVDFEIGLIDRLFGCGTLIVSDASEHGRVPLPDIPRVESVQKRVADELHNLTEPERSDDGT